MFSKSWDLVTNLLPVRAEMMGVNVDIVDVVYCINIV